MRLWCNYILSIFKCFSDLVTTSCPTFDTPWVIPQVMIGPSVIRLHGVFFRHLWFFKDNYFGYDDKCTPLAVHLYNRPLDKIMNTRVKKPCAEVSDFLKFCNLIYIFFSFRIKKKNTVKRETKIRIYYFAVFINVFF